jgi:hypothetical protein
MYIDTEPCDESRRPDRVAGLCLVAPGIPCNRTEGGFPSSGWLARQMKMPYMRILLGMDGPGLVFVRRSMSKQTDRVVAGVGGAAAMALRASQERKKV